MKKKTIACDNCGTRIDHIPEKCPKCGEIIYARMNPHLRDKIEKLLTIPAPSKTLIIIYSATIALLITAIIRQLLEVWDPEEPAMQVGFYIVFAIYNIGVILIILFDGKSRTKGILVHLPHLGAVVFFGSMALVTILMPQKPGNDFYFYDICDAFPALLILQVLGLAFSLTTAIPAAVKLLRKPISRYWILLYFTFFPALIIGALTNLIMMEQLFH
jgi:hypothetical protein